MNEIQLAIQLMGYGLLGIFTVIVLFYVVIKVLLKLFPYKSEEN